MGATRKKDHLVRKGFSYSCTDEDGVYTACFSRDVQGTMREFKGNGPTEREALIDAALDANMFMHHNRELFPDVYSSPLDVA